jgi:hypothetical protein
MRTKREVLFAFNLGVETQTPEITDVDFKIYNLENFVPVFNRLKDLRAHSTYVPLADQTIRALPFSFNLDQGTLNFYAISDDSVFRLEVTDSIEPSFVLVGSFLKDRDTYTDWASWDETAGGTIYFTRLGTFIHKVEGSTLSELPATWNDGFGDRKLSARYCATLQNRLVIGNIRTDDGKNYSRRVQWSDLYNPDDFEIVRGKEGDFFDLESGNLEVTGIFNHRGYLTIFSRNSIWRASYIGYPKIFQFEPIYSDFGNVYHRSAISIKDSIFFIGDDNFYLLTGFSPQPIGDQIWNLWQEVSISTSEDEIPAYADVINNEVMWKFLRAGDPTYDDYRSADHEWLIVYNYKERRWSFRSADGLQSIYSNRYSLRGFQFINQFTEGWVNSGNSTAPVYINEYPWRALTFTAQNQSSDVVTVTSVGHGLSTGDVITVVGSEPEALNVEAAVVTVTGADTFTYPADGDNGAASTLGSTDFRTINGAWQFYNFPEQMLVGRTGDVATYQTGGYVDKKGAPMTGVIESHELFFGSFMGTKEVSEVKLIYRAVGNPVITMQVGYRNDQSEEITWTEKVSAQDITIDSESRFIFTTAVRGKLFTFRIEIENSDTDYIEELNGGALLLAGLSEKGTEV